jgi:hypothetical protein
LEVNGGWAKMALNRKALDHIVDTLKARPLGMSSVEEALALVTNTGISARVACMVGIHERVMRVGSLSESEPNLKAVFPSGEVEIELNRCAEEAWEGRFQWPWDDFCLLLSHHDKTASARIYGSCAAAIEGHYLKDETIPVIGLWDLGAAVVGVLTGQQIPPGGYCSARNELMHMARRAAELLSGISAAMPSDEAGGDTKGETVSS